MHSSPHSHTDASVGGVMVKVLLALLPAIAVYTYLLGPIILLQISWMVMISLLLEAAVLYIRSRAIRAGLADGSVVVTAVLLALALPPFAPWWLSLTGAFFAVVVAKHLYGGLGYNPFNPAMIGYVTLLLAFPLQMTAWPALDQDSLGLAEAGSLVFSQPGSWDGLTGATPLDHTRTGLGLNRDLADIQHGALYGVLGGAGWEALTLAYLIGGGWLLYRGVIGWRIPLALLAALALLSLVFMLLDANAYPGPLFHLASGGAMMAAFFIATDPVTAATTPRGRLIFGAGVGVLTYVIRTWGGYPDGIAFAVLLMNMAVPLIDHYTQPRVYGSSPP